MIYAEILAGGKGTRMGNTEMPKQFLKIGNKPIIVHTIEALLLNERINKIIITTPKQWIQHTNDLIASYISSQTPLYFKLKYNITSLTCIKKLL